MQKRRARVIGIAKTAEATWWESSPIRVDWQVHRPWGEPFVEASGRIMLLGEPEDGGPEGEAVEVGTIEVVKVMAWCGHEPFDTMDGQSADLAAMAGAIFDWDDQGFPMAFVGWCDDEHGQTPGRDVLFIDDIRIKAGHRGAREPLAALAVLEASAAFGGGDTPIVGCGEDMVSEEMRAELRDAGYWDWVGMLRAKPWKGVLVAFRP